MDDFETLLAQSRTAAERWIKFHVSSLADAEDILQETCLAAFNGFAGLRDPERFLPWLLGIARRKTADWYRQQARRREVPVEVLPERASEETEDTGAEEALEALPERDRLMLRLFYQDMLSQKQIALRLRIPEGTVKSRMSAARARLRAAWPNLPKGAIAMEAKAFPRLPDTLPPYTIVWKDEPAFSVTFEELTGWFIIPRLGERLTWGMYDLPSRRLDIAYEMAVTGPASVHGLEGVAISARVLSALPEGSGPIDEAIDASCGGQEEWTFIAQEKDGFTRFLSAEHREGDERTLTTFLDGEAFMASWGFGEDNRGMPVDLKPQGLIRRRGSEITAPEKPAADLAGRCALTLDGVTHDAVCLMDLGMYEEGMISEQYLSREGHTLLWRRFNRDDWALDRYGKPWSALLPENERITVNGAVYVHWYDCLVLR